MNRWVLFCLFLMCLSGEGTAQTNRKIKALQAKKKEIQKGLVRSQKELSSTQKDVNDKMRDIDLLTNQLENRKRYIENIEEQLRQVEVRMANLQDKVDQTELELKQKKADYVKALRFARASKTVHSPLLYVLSTQSVTQMYRRSRYAKEYANYQRTLAERIMDKQNELLNQKNELLKVKGEKNQLRNECMEQRELLQQQQEEEKRNVAGLKKKQKSLLKEVEAQKKQLTDLDKKIDQMIAWEVEQARKRAEEARKRAEREARRKASAGKKKNNGSKKPSSEKERATAVAPEKWIDPQERVLNGSFEKNKGRLPVPITGSYRLGSRFGIYNVPGLKNVRLDNKGTNYVGRAGARARAIFNGEVTAVFQFGATKNVLIRHGSYISVYCNLSSVIVSNGQKVRTRDILGTVEDDGAGNSVLHFQLRKETVKLNPEVWIGR